MNNQIIEKYENGTIVRHVKSCKVGKIWLHHTTEAGDWNGGYRVETSDEILGVVQLTWNHKDIELVNKEELDLVAALVKAKKKKTALNKLVDEAKAEYGAAEEAMQAYFERIAGQATKLYDGVGRVSIDGVEYFAHINEEVKEKAFEEIRAMGRGEIIKPTIHPATLTSFVTELAEEGIEIPPSISYFNKPKLSFAKELKKKTGRGF